MHLTQSQVDGTREIRVNLYFQEKAIILEVRTLTTAYAYNVLPIDSATFAESVHSAWVDVSTMLPIFEDNPQEIDQYLFEAMLALPNCGKYYNLLRLEERPLFAPLPDRPTKARKRRK